MSAARKGRLQQGKTKGEGGADVSYTPTKSDFDSAASKPASSFQAAAPRFKTEASGPEVDMNLSSMGDAASGKTGANWNATKERFQTQQAGPEYSTGGSDFDKSVGKAANMRIPENNKGRQGVQMNQEQVDAPSNYEPVKSEFDVIAGKPQQTFSAAAPRFKTEAAGPEVDLQLSSISDAAAGKGSANWNATKERFSTQQAGPEYSGIASDFDKSLNMSTNMRTPEKGGGRHGVQMNQEQVDAPSNYEPVKSEFDVIAGKPQQSFSAAAPRFKTQAAGPEVDLQLSSISDAAAGKGSANWNATKDRFNTQEAGPEYSTGSSDFDKSIGKASNMRIPEKGSGRQGVQMNQEQVDAPVNYEPVRSEFDVQGGKSSFASGSGQRFKTELATNGEPGGNAATSSDFDRAANNSKPSASSMGSGERFKNTNVSYGDPGAHRTSADVERDQLQAKIARQQQQAEADAARALAE